MYFNIELVHLFSGTRNCETNAGTTLRSKGKMLVFSNSVEFNIDSNGKRSTDFVLLVIHAPAHEIVCSESETAARLAASCCLWLLFFWHEAHAVYLSKDKKTPCSNEGMLTVTL